MEEVIDLDAPVSTNGQAPEAPPEQKQLKDYSDDELLGLRKQLLLNERQNTANLNLVCGVLIGRGHDVDLTG